MVAWPVIACTRETTRSLSPEFVKQTCLWRLPVFIRRAEVLWNLMFLNEVPTLFVLFCLSRIYLFDL